MSRCGERGAAAVLVLPLVGLLTVLALLAAVVAGALVSVRRAQAAADLAALAGAVASGSGEDACGAAARVADRNRARLTSCLRAGLEVAVVVAVETPMPAGRSLQVTARARAGPSRP